MQGIVSRMGFEVARVRVEAALVEVVATVLGAEVAKVGEVAQVKAARLLGTARLLPAGKLQELMVPSLRNQMALRAPAQAALSLLGCRARRLLPCYRMEKAKEWSALR